MECDGRTEEITCSLCSTKCELVHKSVVHVHEPAKKKKPYSKYEEQADTTWTWTEEITCGLCSTKCDLVHKSVVHVPFLKKRRTKKGKTDIAEKGGRGDRRTTCFGSRQQQGGSYSNYDSRIIRTGYKCPKSTATDLAVLYAAL